MNLIPHLFNKLILLYFFIIFINLFSYVHAQPVCEGRGCSDENGRLMSLAALLHLRNSYLNLFLDHMNRAAALNSVMLTPAGVVNLDGTVSLSASGSLSWTMPQSSRPLLLPGTFYSSSLPVAGAYGSFQFQAGLNLGRLSGMAYSPHGRDPALDPVTDILGEAEEAAYDFIEKKTGIRFSASDNEKREVPPGIFSPLRFDIYGIYMKSSVLHKPSSYKISFFKPDLNLPSETEFGSDARGILLRYHCIDAFSILGPVLRFKGLSCGTGYIVQRSRISYLNGNQDELIRNSDGIPYYWDAADFARIEIRTETLPLEISSGLRIFHFLDMSVAAGVAFSRNMAAAEMYRAGRYVSGDEFLQWISEKQKTGFADLSEMYGYPAGFKMYRITAGKKSYRTSVYLKQGTGLDFKLFKITYEFSASADGVSGAAAGIVAEF